MLDWYGPISITIYILIVPVCKDVSALNCAQCARLQYQGSKDVSALRIPQPDSDIRAKGFGKLALILISTVSFSYSVIQSLSKVTHFLSVLHWQK